MYTFTYSDCPKFGARRSNERTSVQSLEEVCQKLVEIGSLTAAEIDAGRRDSAERLAKFAARASAAAPAAGPSRVRRSAR
jgi:hypothetical protein